MKIIWLYKILPAFVFYTENLPKRYGGISTFMFIRLRPKYEEDSGLLDHELTHVRQLYRSCGFSLIMAFIPLIRYWMEIEAYANQMLHYSYSKDGTMDERLKLYVEFILTKYNLGNIKTKSQVTLDLSKKFNKEYFKESGGNWS